MAPWFDWSKNPLFEKVLFKLTKGEKGKVKKLYVGNLAWAVTDEDLQETFSEHGSVASATVINGERQRKIKRIWVCRMEDGADAAIEALNDFELKGRALRVNEAQSKERSGGGGGGRRY